MNAKLCKRLRREARQCSTARMPVRGLVEGFKGTLSNSPHSTRGMYRMLKQRASWQRRNRDRLALYQGWKQK